MEDTKSLLMMVLHKIFQNQPGTIETVFQMIHAFNNGKIEKNHYEATLKRICDLMKGELPSAILVYILTLVDMPQDFESQSPIVQMMRKTHDFLPEINVRPHLLDFLNKNKSAHKSKMQSEKPKPEANVESKEAAPVVMVKAGRTRRRKLLKIAKESPNTLLQICATYVVENENGLKLMYKKKQAKAWSLINDQVWPENVLKQCYDAIEDLNKKLKCLRDIEAKNYCMEFYTSCCAKGTLEQVEGDPFVLPQECEQEIQSLIQNL